MDFFGHQEQARRNTRILVMLFMLAIAAIIVAVYLVLYTALSAGRVGSMGSDQHWLFNRHFAMVAAGVLAVVAMAALFKISQLRGGGAAVAELMGGRPVTASTDDHLERRFFNVVEEMAIASGVPVPAVYVMDREPGINAFAAGFQPGDAAIAVTRGCLERLNRDELQGVIAHEFSHIFNGDMRLNIRLMGVLFGITCLAMAGYVLLRGGIYGGGRRDRGGAAAILGIGLGLVIIGYIGVFFARLIKAAVSRQREFLADAAAVQFTRNPDGISGALKKIGGFSAGSRLANPHAEEASHMFFSTGVGIWLRLFATHPPLGVRISRIEPAFRAIQAREAAMGSEGPVMGFAGSSTPERMVGQIGDPRPEHVAYSKKLLASLPLAVATAAHEPFSARCLVLGLLLDTDDAVRTQQLGLLARQAGAATAHETHVLGQLLGDLPRTARLPVVELAIPALKEMSTEQFTAFEALVGQLAGADRHLSIFEFALQKLLLRHLRTHYRKTGARRVRRRKLEPLLGDCALLISALARAGHDDEAAAQRAFADGAAVLEAAAGIALLPGERCTPQHLDSALSRLSEASPFIKRRVLIAGARAVASDGEIHVDEAELLRAVADTLDCPMPPLAA